MKLSVLIPYRPDCEARERIHAYTAKAWRTTGLEVVYASDGLTGLFSFSQAINNARRMATGDRFLSFSVDALPPSVNALGRVISVLDRFPWAACWPGQIRFSEQQTDKILRGQHPKMVGLPVGGRSMGREALVAVRGEVWDELTGYDERFVGWGPEDKAWHFALKQFYPGGYDVPFADYFRTLSHPTTPREMLTANVNLFKEYRRHKGPAFRSWYLETKVIPDSLQDAGDTFLHSEHHSFESM